MGILFLIILMDGNNQILLITFDVEKRNRKWGILDMFFYPRWKNVLGIWPLWLSYLKEPSLLKYPFKMCSQKQIMNSVVDICWWICKKRSENKTWSFFFQGAWNAYREFDFIDNLGRLRCALFDNFHTLIDRIDNHKRVRACFP